MAPGHDAIYIGIGTHYTTAIVAADVWTAFNSYGKGPGAPGFPSNTLGATVFSTAALPPTAPIHHVKFDKDWIPKSLFILNLAAFCFTEAGLGQHDPFHGSVIPRRFCITLFGLHWRHDVFGSVRLHLSQRLSASLIDRYLEFTNRHDVGVHFHDDVGVHFHYDVGVHFHDDVGTYVWMIAGVRKNASASTLLHDRKISSEPFFLTILQRSITCICADGLGTVHVYRPHSARHMEALTTFTNYWYFTILTFNFTTCIELDDYYLYRT